MKPYSKRGVCASLSHVFSVYSAAEFVCQACDRDAPRRWATTSPSSGVAPAASPLHRPVTAFMGRAALVVNLFAASVIKLSNLLGFASLQGGLATPQLSDPRERVDVR